MRGSRVSSEMLATSGLYKLYIMGMLPTAYICQVHVWQQFTTGDIPLRVGEPRLLINSWKFATRTRVVLCKVPSPRARIADVAVTLNECWFSRREALGFSTLDSESRDRGSNPFFCLCTPASFDKLRSVVRAVGVVLLGFGLFAVGGFSAGFCVWPSFGLYCGPKS